MGAQEARHFEVGFQNLLVELLGVLIFKGQVTADHRVQDDTRTPDICA